MKASKLILSTAAMLATVGAIGAIGVASAQSTNNTPTPAINAPVPSTSKATDPNREAQQRTNKPGTASPADGTTANKAKSGMTDGGASSMDKSNTGRMNTTVPTTTDNSSTGTTTNATPQSMDNTQLMNKSTSTTGSMDRSTNMNNTTRMPVERAPKADRN